MKLRFAGLIAGLLVIAFTSRTPVQAAAVDTGQDGCYDTSGAIPCPQPGEAFFGQDGNYVFAQPAYVDNGDGTISDRNTGLMWQQAPGPKIGWDDAMRTAGTLSLAGYDDWRVPTITELYSLIDFNGVTGMSAAESVPYIDTATFFFDYGDTEAGERFIDAQYWSSTEYLSTTMGGSATVFGVNFADGRIKGYPKFRPEQTAANQMFVRYVRGDSSYGVNAFVDNGDGTITDRSNGLMWTQDDSGVFGAGAVNWADALSLCESLTYAGYADWRLPDAKELQYIVDYTRAPDATGSAAIDPLFNVTGITDEAGSPDFPFYWTSTTHLDGNPKGARAVYIAFGEAEGYLDRGGTMQLFDVHGAGAQRSDLKDGDPAQFPTGHGPQGDVQRIFNYVRCVRGGDYTIFTGGTVEAGDAGPPPEGGQQPGSAPPQMAIDTCAGLSQGAACSFTTPQGEITGTCAVVQQQLACVPEGGPGGGQQPPGQ